jgi:hypothetical protein
MIKINILHGSSCVGKSTIMNNKVGGVNKVEMDDCNFWRFRDIEWHNICINFLIENIINNLHKKDMIVTCGGLPLPNHEVYAQLEKEYSIKFVHTLVLVKDIENYKSYIKKRKRTDIMNYLLEQYKWRESTKDLHDDVIYT